MIFLFIYAFKDRLRFSRITTVFANFVVLTLYYISFKRIIGEDFYNLDIMLAYRMVQIFVVLILCIYFINDFIQKVLFVFGQLLPISVFVLVWASHTNNYITIKQSATYLDTAVLRIIISCVCFPFMYILWKKYIVPVVKTQIISDSGNMVG